MEFVSENSTKIFLKSQTIKYFHEIFNLIKMDSRMEMESKEDFKSSEVEMLRQFNRLAYDAPSNISQIESRQYKSYAFSSLTWAPGSLAQCLIQTGADAGWGKSAYLKMTFTVNNLVTFGNGSGLSFFQNSRLYHRTGQILEQIQNINVLAQVKRWYENSLTDKLILDSMVRGGAYKPADNTAGTYIAIIPLRCLYGTFDTDNMLPPGYLSGARMEFDLAQENVIDSSAAGAISNISFQFQLDSSILYDDVKKQLLVEQSNALSSGLQFTYPTYFGTQVPLSAGQTSISFDLLYAASMTSRVIYCIVPTPAGAYDHFTFPGTRWQQFQHRLAGFYMPVQPVSLAVDFTEGYAQAIYNMDDGPHQYTMRQKCGSAVDYTLWGSTYGIVCQSLERSPVGLTLSGTPTNNSIQLHLDATITALPAGGGILYAWLETYRVANILGDNLVVDY